MRTSDLNRMAMYVCALAMIVCAICGNQIMLAAGDADDVWDPATHFAPHWTSVSLTTRVDAPSDAAAGTGVPLDSQYSRTLSIQTEADIIDSNGLVALTPTVTNLLITDENGLEIPTGDIRESLLRMYQTVRVNPARAGRLASVLPYSFGVSVPMDANAVWPQLISRMEWSAYALLAHAEEVIDVPFRVTQDWIPLAPGLEILVTQARTEDNKYEYIIRSRYDPNQVAYLSEGLVFIHKEQQLADRMVIETQILNTEGYPVGGTAGSSGHYTASPGSGLDGQKTYTVSGNGTCSDCGTATTFRYRFAVAPYQQEVRFVLEDVPVPLLDRDRWSSVDPH
ncbi:MAG: hypothetical protein JW955_00590 [Sedimentisphaerales bacterium]|nr:hypothetical protein [Sedimentisphaerales bacterium]